MSACRSCGAPITWGITDNGRRIPLDLGTHPDGRLVVVGSKRDTPLLLGLRGDQLERLRAAEGDVELELVRSHFQTCPDADTWRRA